MLKLYYWPGTCSIAIHILLEEIGVAYERQTVDLGQKQQYSAEFLAINPKGKVPALVRGDGSLLTEVPAIAMWLAATAPSFHLVPDDIEGRTRVMEIMSYIAGTVHIQGAARAWRPALFSTHREEQEAVVARGREIVLQGLDILSDALDGKEYLAGEYSIADPFLFFIEYWAAEKVGYPLPANIDAHYNGMRKRPAVRRALAAEGLA